MDDLLADILETCLLRIDAGVSVDECLAAYPQQRGALEAPLRAAAQVRALPRPPLPEAARANLEARMLALAAQRRAAAALSSRPQPAPRSIPDLATLLAGALRALGYRGPLARPWLRLGVAAIALVLALALGTGALAAARAIVRAIQGPPLTPTPTLPAATPFTLDGPIQQIAPGRWQVNGISVALDPQTAISGTPALGAVAHIRGAIQANTTLLARSIAVEAAPTPTSAPTSAPLPTSPPAAPTAVPTALPAPEPSAAPNSPAGPAQPAQPGESQGPGSPARPGEGGDRPDHHGEGGDKPDKPPKPDRPEKPDKPPKPKPGKPGKGKGKD
jgi:hypothetical protein